MSKARFSNDGENNWVHRWPLTVATIKRYAPDIIGFQEVQSPNQATLEAELTEYAFELGPETARENSTGHGYHNAIYWNPARFEKWQPAVSSSARRRRSTRATGKQRKCAV